MISLITCTGGREDAFKLCKQYISSQKNIDSKIEWIIIDDTLDDRISAPLNSNYKLDIPIEEIWFKDNTNILLKTFPGPKIWEPGYNTHRTNMELALSKVTGDIIFIIEDDDFFSSSYIETTCRHLKYSKAVGLSNSRYYKVDFPGWKTMKNFEHASLSQTAFHRTLLPLMKKAVNSGEFYFDIAFWKEVHKQNIPFTLLANTNLSIGMKGLPGRPGLTPSHKENKGYMMDPNYDKLKEWLGVNWKNYEPWLKKRASLKS